MKTQSMILLSTAFVAWACLTLSSDAYADSMRCGNRLVASGDSLYKVRQICGDPDASERRVELRTQRHRVRQPCSDDPSKRCEVEHERTVEVVVDEWTYDFGRNRFVQYVTFEQGKLIAVDSGSYGHKEPT
jgi:hypothetical protein